jgi:hypothetical protein
MKAYETDFLSWLAAHDIRVAEEAGNRYVLGRESLLNLEALYGELLAQVERHREVVLEIEGPPSLHRYAVRELKDDVKCLKRRLGHLMREVSQDLASGIPREGTSRDRQEIEALAVAVPIMEVTLEKARRDLAAVEAAGTEKGAKLVDKQGPHPLVVGKPRRRVVDPK